jgi:hypothetical protein
LYASTHCPRCHRALISLISLQGYSTLQTYLLAIAQGSIIMAWLFSGAWLAKRYNQKLLIEFVRASGCANYWRQLTPRTDIHASSHCGHHRILEFVRAPLFNNTALTLITAVRTRSDTKVGLLLAF